MLVTVEPASTEKSAAVPRPTGASAALAPVPLKINTATAVPLAATAASADKAARRRWLNSLVVTTCPFAKASHQTPGVRRLEAAPNPRGLLNRTFAHLIRKGCKNREMGEAGGTKGCPIGQQ
ncbi:hypothetical protein GCM10011576_05370 [Micromonospora parathelypteridis]|nr:hypothetical protein GCM10011576_05370 [Micromonospora parathelypteridis]